MNLWPAAILVFAAGPAFAGAWTLPKGKGQAIVKYERMRADQGFGLNGQRLALPVERRDRVAGLFAEYGLTDAVTVQLKTDWQEGRDRFADFEGRGPVELGLTWRLHRDDRWAASLYGGVAQGGAGRNAGYAQPGRGDRDAEVRLSVGRSFSGGQASRWTRHGGYAEVQVARRLREGLRDEVRLDATLGAYVAPDWLVLTQVYAGATDDDGPRWANVETSVVREVGDWRIQAGWRTAVAGRDTPAPEGFVLGLWRSF